jgi:predicted amidohydrolase YtcJ
MPDIVIENARIWSDGRTGFAEFAAAEDGRFTVVGEHDPALAEQARERIDAEGRVVVPGLIDSHLHMLGGGRSLGQLHLADAENRDDFVRRVAEYAAAQPSGAWIEGWGWNVDAWSEPIVPHRDWIDSVCGDRPALLRQIDIHSALVNSAALAMAGITKDGPADPEGGVIERDPETGEPTGILREAALHLVRDLIPDPAPDEQAEAVRAASRHALAHGVTAVGDIPFVAELGVYERLRSDQGIVRLFLYPIVEDWSAGAMRLRDFAGQPGWVEARGLKGFVDGTLGSRTAYMQHPYNTAEGDADRKNRGLLCEGMSFERLVEMFRTADVAGWQPIVHAIGDGANHMCLDAYEMALEGRRSRRPRIEHAQHLLPEDIERFGELGVIACMQPFHLSYDAETMEDLLGSVRCECAYVFKSLLDGGAVIAFGSDWPVVSINPFTGIAAAVQGRTIGRRRWRTDDLIPVTEALRAYTSSAAYALGAEHEIGKIEPGYRADFVILDESPFSQEADVHLIRPVATYLEGACAYRRDDHD